MLFDEKILKSEEQAVFALRALYQQYGYTQYKMSKFEEYDLYVQNKDFLVGGEGVITFNDTSGKLLALKPDVTLSIIKNSKSEAGLVQKLYYNENVYRISKNTHTFKEIMQTGLECVGDIDLYSQTEVVLLAVRSLAAVSDRYVLDISHLGLVSALVNAVTDSESVRKKLIRMVGEKNAHGVRELCVELGVEEAFVEKLTALVHIYGKPESVLPKLRTLNAGEQADAAIAELEAIMAALSAVGFADYVNIDFSVVNDMDYYSGIVFRGFVEGIPEGILSGGRYDKLMCKMGKKACAIGFAVYLDMLQHLDETRKEFDTDIVLLYDETADTSELMRAVSILTKSGNTVITQKTMPQGIRFRQLLSFRNGGLEILEIHS